MYIYIEDLKKQYKKILNYQSSCLLFLMQYKIRTPLTGEKIVEKVHQITTKWKELRLDVNTVGEKIACDC